jgi:trigger factor
MPHLYTLKDLPHSRKQLTITSIDEVVLSKAEHKALQNLSQNVRLKGFRPGKIPASVIRQEIDPSYIRISTVEQALPIAFHDIATERGLRVIGQPNVNFENIEPLKIVMEFDILPRIELGGYTKITVNTKKKNATDDDVNQAIEEMRKRSTEYSEVDRAAKEGDRAEIDFQGFTLDGVPLDSTTSKNHPVVLGSSFLIPGFEKAVEGMKKGEEKDFEITFPKDYHAKQLANKPVKFHVKLNRLEEGHLPELNEELIAKLSGKKQSLEEWKPLIRGQIQGELDQIAKQESEEEYFSQLIKLAKVDLPQILLDEEKKAVLQEIKERILYQGLSYERYLAAAGKNEEQLIESFQQQAEDRIKLRMALEEISKIEKISISDVDIEEKLNELLISRPESEQKKLKQQYRPDSAEYRTLSYQLTMKKTLEKILPKV